MMEENSILSLEEAHYEQLIQGLIDKEFGSVDHFISDATTLGLRNNLLNLKKDGKMHPAGVGRNFDFQKNADVRGDVIHWIHNDSHDIFERKFLDKVDNFIQYLNRTCYTSINDYEFHYAFYDENSFYKRHLDQFKSDKGRKFSLVMYLNENWGDQDGGEISLYTNNGDFKLKPEGGKVVFFKSDETEHEVHPTFGRFRISIAGWLKSI